MNREIVKVKFRRYIAKYLSGFVYSVFYLKFKMLNFNNKPPVLILTPGKVGSSSVYYTLKKNLKNNNVFHIHYISQEGITRAKLNHLNSDRKSLPLHLIVSELLFNKLKDYKGKIKIITIIREPISRSISSFFQNIDFHKKSIENNNLVINEEKALKILNEDIKRSIKDIDDWFQTEIKNNYDIDIYGKVFSQEKYMIYKKNKAELLLLKMEDLDFIFTDSTKAFFNLKKGFELENFNIGGDKYYSKQYLNVRKNIKIDNNILTNLLSSKYFIHFYKDKSKSVMGKYCC